MWRQVVTKGRSLISAIAIFTLLCAVVAIAITFLWWVYPFCDVRCLLVGRWLIAMLVVLWLLSTKHIVINPHAD